LAHELNQPLAAITNYAQGCLHRVRQTPADSASLIEPLTLMNEQAQRASDIIRRLRSFVRKRDAVRTPVAPKDVIHDTLVLVGPNIRDAQASVEQSIEPGLPRVCVDAIQIEQVLINLIRNALEAVSVLPVEQRCVRIEAWRDGDRVAIDVRDAGRGVEPADREAIFEPFFTTRPGGMGMGLTISRSIAEAHDGALAVVARADGGTAFRLSLPVQAPAKVE